LIKARITKMVLLPDPDPELGYDTVKVYATTYKGKVYNIGRFTRGYLKKYNIRVGIRGYVDMYGFREHGETAWVSAKEIRANGKQFYESPLD
jgi:hypothetical protein